MNDSDKSVETIVRNNMAKHKKNIILLIENLKYFKLFEDNEKFLENDKIKFLQKNFEEFHNKEAPKINGYIKYIRYKQIYWKVGKQTIFYIVLGLALYYLINYFRSFSHK